MNSKKFKFTQEDLDNMVREALGAESVGTPKAPGKPNILQMMRAKKELGNQGGQWPLV